MNSDKVAKLLGRGIRVVAEVMHEKGLLKHGQDERNSELFQRALSLYHEVLMDYIAKHFSEIDDIWDLEEKHLLEIAYLVIQQLRRFRV